MSDLQYAVEYNFDGLVGPTHNYAGLAFGNKASLAHAGAISSPKQAAKQGLEKMHTLMELGIPQAVIPPQQRPNFSLLRSLGFSGDDAKILQQAYRYNPSLLAMCYSAANMWTANMATLSPSSNTQDHTLHITPANLTYHMHRAQEAEFSYQLLKKIFSDPKYFTVHQPLAAYKDLGDEGAANHSVLCKQYGNPGLELFVYGKQGLNNDVRQSLRFPARQSKLASSSIKRNHGLRDDRTLLVQQNPLAIDAGVFHNDVICVANKNVMFYHSQAFLEWLPARLAIERYFSGDFHFIEISPAQLSLEEAVETYIFNSQLVSLPGSNGDMALIVPMECKKSRQATDVLNSILTGNNPIKLIQHVECRESMHNGGGPACLRMRAILTKQQLESCHQGLILDDRLYAELNAWIERNYRDTLVAEDLLDPLLSQEVFRALDELTQLLNLGSIYPFQQL